MSPLEQNSAADIVFPSGAGNSFVRLTDKNQYQAIRMES
jgi:hypothetical protein